MPPRSPAPPAAVPRPDGPEFSRPRRVARLDPRGEDLAAEATEAERAALARRFGVAEVRALSMAARLIPDADGWRVEGRVRARVVQPCVVTLEPVVQRLDEVFTRRLLPGAPAPELTDLDPDEDEDPPEPLGAVIDPAEMAAEAAALAIEPYPRKPGAVFAGAAVRPADAAPEPETPEKPFAGLAALRDRLGGKGGGDEG